jgi:hypothetical protein
MATVAPAVAQRIREGRVRRSRTLDERAMVHFPRLYARLASAGSRLSPRSRLRQQVLHHQLLSGWAAASRGDFELVQTRYAPELVYEFNPELVTLGLPARVEGRDAWLAAISEFRSVWTEWRFTPSYLLDLGERVVNLGRAWYRGDASGVELEIEYAQLIEHRSAIVLHERDFTGWPAALKAAGIDPDVLPRLKALAPGEAMEL